MKMRFAAVLLLAAITLPLAACGDDDDDGDGKSDHNPTAPTVTVLPSAPVFDCERGVDISFGRTSNATNRFSVRIACNFNAMFDSPIRDLNGAEVDMYRYASDGSRRKYTTQYANSMLNGRVSTLLRDVDTDNAIKVVFQVYPYRSDTPVRATFPTEYRNYQRITEGINLRHNSTDGLMYLQGPLPPVSSTFSVNSTINGVQRIDDQTVEPAKLTEVVDAAGNVLCSDEATCLKFRQ
jgi:hypothetical protein